MYNGFLILGIMNIVFLCLMSRDNKLDVFKLYPLYVGGWLVYHFVFSDTPVDNWSYLLGALLGVGAASLYLFDRFVDKDIHILVQPIVLLILLAMPLIMSIAIVTIYYILVWG